MCVKSKLSYQTHIICVHKKLTMSSSLTGFEVLKQHYTFTLALWKAIISMAAKISCKAKLFTSHTFVKTTIGVFQEQSQSAKFSFV